jgi:hypothetical protein
VTAAAFADIESGALRAFHDRYAAEPDRAMAPERDEAWRCIAANHRCNGLLWAEEDLARRMMVPAAEIVANKRAIDRLNQQRNDAIETLDAALLARIANVAPLSDAWHNSETAGAIIDRLSILALKRLHMARAAQRDDATPALRAECAKKLARLELQAADLGRCLDTLLARAAQGTAFWRVYRQIKMYNDPELNPALRGSRDA